MRALLPVLLTTLVSAARADHVALSQSRYFDQHVTVEDRRDHYLVHFNVQVTLDERPDEQSLRMLHASVLYKHDGENNQVAWLKQSVRLTLENDTWSFYFRVPKSTSDPAGPLYAVVASVDGVTEKAVAVWRFGRDRLDLGTADEPWELYYPVGRAVPVDTDDGSFRLTVVYEVELYTNNYDSLPTCGYLKPQMRMPDPIDAERGAKRVVD